MWAAVADASDGADVVLVPGSPLTHPDHAWLVGAPRERLAAEPLALYAEQPYTAAATASAPVRAASTARAARDRRREVACDPARTARSCRCSGCAEASARGPLRLALGRREGRLAPGLGSAVR